MDCPSRCVIDLARSAFISLVALEAAAISDVFLEIRLVLAQVMPKTCETRPVSIPEGVCESAGQPRHLPEMLLQRMEGETAVQDGPHMRDLDLITHGRGPSPGGRGWFLLGSQMWMLLVSLANLQGIPGQIILTRRSEAP
jgi:hypothetical protein